MRIGMPLGNLTSQFFANLYLNELDQYVKHILKIKYYIRYVDDFVIFSHSKEELEVWKEQINEFLKKHLKIELHPDKSYISLLSRGIPFLGFRIFYYHKLLRKSNIKNFERKMRELKILYKEKRIRREQVIEKLEGWMAYARYGNTYNYRREILRQFNRHFPIYHKNQIIRNKKIKNFYRKVYASKIEFSVQKTLFLVREGLDVGQIAVKRGIKEGTVWTHFVNLVEYGQLPIWNIIPKKKIVKIMQNIRSTNETLKQIRERIKDRNISYDEIACVKAHLIMKEKIKISNYRRNQQQGK